MPHLGNDTNKHRREEVHDRKAAPADRKQIHGTGDVTSEGTTSRCRSRCSTSGTGSRNKSRGRAKKPRPVQSANDASAIWRLARTRVTTRTAEITAIIAIKVRTSCRCLLNPIGKRRIGRSSLSFSRETFLLETKQDGLGRKGEQNLAAHPRKKMGGVWRLTRELTGRASRWNGKTTIYTLALSRCFPSTTYDPACPFLHGTRADLLFLLPILTDDRYRENARERGVLARALNPASSLWPLLFPPCSPR